MYIQFFTEQLPCSPHSVMGGSSQAFVSNLISYSQTRDSFRPSQHCCGNCCRVTYCKLTTHLIPCTTKDSCYSSWYSYGLYNSARYHCAIYWPYSYQLEYRLLLNCTWKCVINYTNYLSLITRPLPAFAVHNNIILCGRAWYLQCKLNVQHECVCMLVLKYLHGRSFQHLNRIHSA